MKKILYSVAALALLLVAAAVVAPIAIDEEQIKARIGAEVAAATGRELVIDGHLDLALLPRPRISLGGLRLANLEGASARHMVSLKGLEATVALVPLLSGEIEVTSLRLVEPVIELERLADGRANWVLGGRAGGSKRMGWVGISVDRLDIENGTLTYRDAASGRLVRFPKVEARLTAGSLQGPFTAAGTTRLRGVPLGFELTVGELREGRSLPLRAALTLGDEGARVAFSGAVSELGAEGKLRGKLRAEGASLADFVSFVAASADSPLSAPPLLAQAFRLEAQVAASATEAGFNDLSLTLGGARATGAVNVAMNKALNVDVTLAFNRLDLDAWLRSAAKQVASRGLWAGRGDKPVAAASVFAIPAGLGGSLALNLEAVMYRGKVMRQVQLEGTLGNGRFELARASALLPGSSDILISGTALTEGGETRFDGRLEVASDNLRRLIGWLGVDLSGVPLDRLNRLSLTSRLRLTPKLVQASGIDLRLDTSRLTGAAAYALRERPSFSLDVAVDRFNLDAYLPGVGAAEAPEGEAEAGPKFPPLAVLETFDSNIKARVDSLIVNKLKISGLTVDASLVGGILSVRRASVEHLAGTSAAVSGTARDFSTTPSIKASVDLRSGDAGRFLTAIGVRAPKWMAGLGATRLRGSLEGRVNDLAVDLALAVADARVRLEGGVGRSRPGRSFDLRLDLSHPDLAGFAETLGLALPRAMAGEHGAVTVKGTVAGNFEAFAVDLAAEAAGATVSVAGDVVALTPPPRFDLRLSADHPSLVKVATMFGIELGSAPGRHDGPITVAGRIVGTPAGLSLDRLSVRAAGADLKLSGSLDTGAERLSYQLDLEAEHPDLASLLGTLGIDYRPRGFELGGLALRTWMAGDASSVRLAGLEGRIGSVDFAGAISARWDTERPRLTGNLKSSAVIAPEGFLPRPPGAAPGAALESPGAEAGTRWSTDQIDIAWFEAFDAELELAAGGIVFQGYEFSQPRVTVKLADGVLDIDPLAGKLFDGDVSVRARIQGDSGLAVGIGVRLEDGDLLKALVRAAGVDRVSGRFEFEGQFQARGRSQLELVSSLAGKGTFAARDGAIHGLDLVALSDRLGRLDTVVAPLDLVDATLGGGQTRMVSIEGDFQLARGIAATDGLRLVLEGGQAIAQGTVDLPLWRIDFRTRFDLPDHPAAPGFAIDLTGPLDAARKILRTGELERFVIQRSGGLGAGSAGNGGQPPAEQSADRPRAASEPVGLVRQGVGSLGEAIGANTN